MISMVKKEEGGYYGNMRLNLTEKLTNSLLKDGIKLKSSLLKFNEGGGGRVQWGLWGGDCILKLNH